MKSRRIADVHAVLGLAPGASAADVQRAYRRRARLLHPDVAGPGSTHRMAELNLARDELMAGMLTASDGGAEAGGHPGTRRPAAPRPTDTEAAWEDYWSTWSELPKRGEQSE